VRVVAGDYTLDFTELKGTIEEDLSQRDFTVNSIAWSEKEGVIDPFNGVQDIKKKKSGLSPKKTFWMIRSGLSGHIGFLLSLGGR